jgi:hypothetical protein
VKKRTTSGIRNVRLINTHVKEPTQEPCQPYNLSDRPRTSFSAGQSPDLPRGITCILPKNKAPGDRGCYASLARNNDVTSNVLHAQHRRSLAGCDPTVGHCYPLNERWTTKLPNCHSILPRHGDPRRAALPQRRWAWLYIRCRNSQQRDRDGSEAMIPRRASQNEILSLLHNSGACFTGIAI